MARRSSGTAARTASVVPPARRRVPLAMAVLVLNVASALVMTGVIWTVQLVVYPAFRLVPESGWAAYHAQHSRRITYVVGPVMLVELGTSVLLVTGDTVSGALPWAGLAATLVALGMTGAVHSPDHGRLSRSPDPRIIDRQIGLGWIRTAAWTAHGAIALALLA